MTMIWTLTPPQNQTFRKIHGHSCTKVNDRLRKISKDAMQDIDIVL